MADSANEAMVDWGHFDALVEEGPPKTTWVEKMDIGFEQIASTAAKVVYLQERLASQHLKGSKKLKVECQLADLQLKIARLEAAHEEGAKILRQRSLALAALPRELRDAIFEQIYVYTEPIEITWSRLGNEHIYHMPKDVALYMSSLHVGPELAREAAEIFYQRNIFTFVRGCGGHMCFNEWGFTSWEHAHINNWFLRDHYGSGILPKDYVRHLELRIDRPGYCYNGSMFIDWQNPNGTIACDHIAFENICNAVQEPTQDYRRRIEGFLQYENLRTIRFMIPQLGEQFDTVARMLNPVTRAMKASGFHISFVQHDPNEEGGDLDLTSIFETPTDEDYAQYYELTQRKSVFTDDPSRGIFDAWKVIDTGGHAYRSHKPEMLGVYVAEVAKFGFMRVWLFEHYEMYTFMKRDRELLKVIEGMVQEFRNLSPEERDLRRSLYPKVMDYFK